MAKILPLGLGLLLLPLAVSAATPEQAAFVRSRQAKTQLAMMKQRSKAVTSDFERADNIRRIVSANPETTQTDFENYGFLDGPNGQIWFYTMDYDYEIIQHPAYAEQIINGFELQVYDDQRKLVGSVKDKITYAENEIRVAAIGVDYMVSKKFFNTDNRYEIVVNLAMNRPDYTVRTYGKVYSIGAATDSEGNTPCVMELPGYINAAENTATASWDENFFIAIQTETGYDETKIDNLGEYADSNKYVFTVYKKAGWSSGPQAIGDFRVSGPHLPGDQMRVPYFMMDTVDGKLRILFQYYEKWFFKNAIGPSLPGEDETDGMPFDDNHLIVEEYTCTSFGSTLTEGRKWSVLADQATDNPDIKFQFYSIGHLLYTDDVMEDGSLAVAIQGYRISDDDNYLTSFVKYDKDGKKVKDIAVGIDIHMALTDLRGFDRQVMFVKGNGDSSYNLIFVDMPSGNEILNIPSLYQNIQLKANVDRYPVGDSYEYAFQTAQMGNDDEGNVLERIVWINAEGDITHSDVLNLGNDVSMAQVYMASYVFSPYIFDTDDEREYMWLVRRYVDKHVSSTETDTWLYILSPKGKLFELGPDPEKGDISSVSYINTPGKPALWISYAKSDENNVVHYSQDFYTLPFVKFAEGGDGTEANPYKISTVGDLEQLRAFPSAHFEVAADIVADGVELTPVPDFSGVLDGKDHKITGLQIAGPGLFENIANGTVKNLKLIGARILSHKNVDTGLIAAYTNSAKISNVHIFGLDIEASEEDDLTFGGIVGMGAMHTEITDCSLNSAEISLPGSTSVGGIAGDLRTGSSVKSCSVHATISAMSELGGIVGAVTGDNIVSDCHADVNLTARATVGGIVGSSSGSEISRCYVEGTISTTGGMSQWYDHGPCAGGILGAISSAITTDGNGNQVVLTTPTVFSNFVNLTSMTGHTPSSAPSYEGQQKTMHRIVGSTQVNMEPEIIDYDSDDEPVYGEANPADQRFKDNYAVADLAVVQDDIEALATTTEGASVNSDQLSAEWFAQNLGLEYAEDKPWNEMADFDPALKHEGGNFCSPDELTVEEGETFDIYVVFVGNAALSAESIMDSFSYTTSDENIVDMGADMSLTKGRLAVQFEAKAPGKAVVDICGAKCSVTVTEKTSGIGSAAAPEASLDIDGEYVRAAGMAIEVYNVSGMLVASGSDAVRISTLAPGIYVARAASATGTGTAKFIVR